MRVLLPICFVTSFVAVIGASSAGCGGIGLPPGGEYTQNGNAIPGAPPGKCSADGTWYQVTAGQCGYLNCTGGDMAPAYALCDGTSFNACTCTKPDPGSGWTQIQTGPVDSGSFPDYFVPETGSPPPHDSGHDSGEAGGEGGDSSPPADTGPKDTGTDG